MNNVYTVQCIECNYIFGDFEDEFGKCPECGVQQPASGSWASKELEQIEILTASGKVSEAVDLAMELLHKSVDIEYGDWPFAHNLTNMIRELCQKENLTSQISQLDALWKLIEANQMGGDRERTVAYEKWRNSQ